jgi:NTP pyrophosphatase (non-canonical NTP hydrolase)
VERQQAKPLQTVSELQRECWQINEDHGFHEDFGPHTMIEKLALITTEVAEAIEEWRDGRGADEIYYTDEKPGKPEGVPVELADVVIRTLGLAHQYGIELVDVINLKIEYNRGRPFKHGRML